MAYVHIDVDLGDFHSDELIEELEDRGYRIVDDEDIKLSDAVFNLYTTYMTCSREFFMKELDKFFTENVQR